MADLEDGKSVEVKGSAKKPYVLKNTGGVYSCTCPAWRNQSVAIERRTCKHLRKLRGDQAETKRVGELPAKAKKTADKKNKPPLLLAHRWENDRDLTGWWISEKLDGVRAYWDGKSFFSRLGNRFIAPDWFTAGLPEVPLDGELWTARRQFQKTVSIVRRQDASQAWEAVRFLVFDAPAHDGRFEERLEYVRGLFDPPAAYAEAHEHQICKGLEHMHDELERVEALGGEGLMLRQPGSLYEEGRSTTLLKVKNFYDAEAKVLAHLPGSGRHKGRLGALDVTTPEGVRFSVGTGLSDAEREAPPPIGAIVTYRYQELTDDGMPRFPSFIGVRTDFAWPEEGAPTPAPKKAAAPKKVAAPKKAESAPEIAANASTRRFELVDGKSSKFWEITLDGAAHQVRYGKIGSQGQVKSKTFADPQTAAQDAERLIAAKQKKGYVAV